MTDLLAERQRKMYGFTVAEMTEHIGGSLTMKMAGPAMCVMSLMSDAQEEIAHGMAEQARQTINRAKWTLSTYMMEA
jgi:hypothetical protein